MDITKIMCYVDVEKVNKMRPVKWHPLKQKKTKIRHHF